MPIRRRFLPAGWYPTTAEGVLREIRRADLPRGAGDLEGRGGIVPHAGWSYSGRIAARVLHSLEPGTQTVVVVGGHLRRTDSVLAAFEDAYETPLGQIPADIDLLEELRSSHVLEEDVGEDNTVEVQLPLIRCFLPEAMVLGLRAPPGPEAVALGEAIRNAAAALGRRVAVVGSTDLTHYGPVYGFTPHGIGEAAVAWVRGTNDARIVRALLALDCAETLAAAREDRSACSVGGALAAVGFAHALGVGQGRLLAYATSLDGSPVSGRPQDAAFAERRAGDSFVGYAGILYPGDA